MNNHELASGVVQIATPYHTGSGFYLKSHDMIVTCEHVVRDNQKVVVTVPGHGKYLLDVLYLDSRFDLAFVAAPPEQIPLDLASSNSLKTGRSIGAYGYNFEGELISMEGKVKNEKTMIHQIPYIEHNISMSPGMSGGPLISEDGSLLGVNSFVRTDFAEVGFSLPYSSIVESLEHFHPSKERVKALRCFSCSHIIQEKNDQTRHCPVCADPIQFLGHIPDFEPSGMPRSIEGLLVELEHNPALARHGKNQWKIKRGSAMITISYHEKSGMISSESRLCRRGKSNFVEINRFLLQQNDVLRGLTFSIRGEDIILSMLIYDQFLNDSTAKVLLQDLFVKSDEYDDILVNEWGCQWI